MSHSVKILAITDVTHNVRRYTIERPEGYDFTPGQATDVSLDEDGWRDKKRPFTFTALADAPHLELTIKSYLDREGVTKRLYSYEPGQRLIIRDVWGTIAYKGPGTFIAGGAGVTPFIAILRDLNRKRALDGHMLVVSNQTEADIILRDEFEAMEGLRILWTLTNDPASQLLHERINGKFFERHIHDFEQSFYLCGPDEMVKQLRETLAGFGAKADAVVWEK